jgi:hypothetical protein
MRHDEALGNQIADARKALGRWGRIMPIDGNMGWLALQDNLLRTAKRLARQMIGDAEALAAKNTDPVTMTIAALATAARCVATFDLIDYVENLKSDAEKAEAFLALLKTRE